MSLLDARLEAFLAIAESGTVHGASDRLGLTQTGVTQRIRSLESKLGVTLFTRSRKGMRKTQEGEKLQRYCLGALELESQTGLGDNNLENKKSVSVTIAGPTSIMSARIIPRCFELYQKFPNLLLHYRLYDEENRVELLKKGLVDFAILSPDEVSLEMDSKILKPDKYLLVATSKWKGRRLVDLVQKERIIDFHEKDETTIRYLKKYELFEHARKDRLYANTNFAIISMFKAGLGYGTLTEEIAAPHLENGDFVALNSKQSDEDPKALAWYPRQNMPDYFKSIVQSVK